MSFKEGKIWKETDTESRRCTDMWGEDSHMMTKVEVGSTYKPRNPRTAYKHQKPEEARKDYPLDPLERP